MPELLAGPAVDLEPKTGVGAVGPVVSAGSGRWVDQDVGAGGAEAKGGSSFGIVGIVGGCPPGIRV